MKRTVVGLIIVISIAFSCKKDFVRPKLEIVEIINDTLNINDTLEIHYESAGIENIEDIEVLLDEQKCLVIANENNLLKAIITHGVGDGVKNIYLKHPQINSQIYYLTIEIIPTVTDFYPKEGIGGDTLKILGWGFDKFTPYNIVRVNSLPADIIHSSDTLLLAVIPKGCGSGIIRLQSYYTTHFTYEGELFYWLDQELICGEFKYKFKEYSGNIYPTTYKESWSGGNELTYVRQNGILQKITYSTDKFVLFKYKQNTIDSIINYENGELIGYETFLFNESNDELIHNFYNSKSKRIKYHKYFVLAHPIIGYYSYENLYIKGIYFKRHYSDLLDKYGRYYAEKEYCEYGADYICDVVDSAGFIDIYNRPLDFNIPGYPFSIETIWIYNAHHGYNQITYHNYYNEFGLLIKRVRCPLGISEKFGFVQEYRYD